MNLQRGMRDKLDKYLNLDSPFTVEVNTTGSSAYRVTCFGLDWNDKLADERYMISRNQDASPNQEVMYTAAPNGAEFCVNLMALPSSVAKLVFAVSVDGNGTMSQVDSHVLRIKQDGNSVLELAMSGGNFYMEKAIISVEIYKKDTWRVAAVARGFDGGLTELLKAYNAPESAPATVPTPVPAPDPTPAPAPVPEKSELEKKLEESAPQLAHLAKPLLAELKKQDMLNCAAQMALVMDMSGSMSPRYEDGTVQHIIQKIMPMVAQFDDNGKLDFWYYGNNIKRMPALNIFNYQSAVPFDWEKFMINLGYGNDEPKAIKAIMDEYEHCKVPAYVLFITDGGVESNRTISKLLTKASKLPIFWQFMGVEGKDYGIFEQLDTITDRYADNAAFFAVDNFKTVSNETLYSNLLASFPKWLKEVKSKGMVS